MRHTIIGITLGACTLILALPALAQVEPRSCTATGPAAVPGDASGGLRPGAHTIVVDGVRLWYCVAGNARPDVPPVVFLHGGPGGSSYDWAALAGPQLERSLRMVYFDQRGSGRSERPWTGEYSIDRLVEDVEGLRRALGVPKIAIMGHSFGGLLGLEYAAKYPEHVSRLVFVAGLSDAATSGRSMCQRLAQTNPEAYARAVADSADRASSAGCNWWRGLRGEERQAFLSANMYPDSSVRIRRDSVIARSGLRNTQELSQALFKAGLGNYRFTAHERLTMPVLIVVGRHDYQVGMEAPQDLARRLPNARLLVYEKSGHHLHLDEPERFAREVTAFLTAPPARGKK